MKKQLYMVITVIALLAVAGLSSANAQTQSSVQLKANIPFAFSVGDKTMPAGEYTVRCTNPSSDMKVLQLRNSNGHESSLVRTISVIGKIQDDARLVFYRYGDRYFLAQVWLASDTIGMQTPKSRSEKQMARELAANKRLREAVALTVKR
ncbi:MAG TPA: hypothetical protein VGW76_20485 [Pyrinomonadaceae bacterium]|nr:hypothetical protein [Pyrinomonadaceae bacterium]